MRTTSRPAAPRFRASRRRSARTSRASVPGDLRFLATTTARALAADQLQTPCENWNQVHLAYAKRRNLTPDVLIIASMVEKDARA
jgi:hypothetical protein